MAAVVLPEHILPEKAIFIVSEGVTTLRLGHFPKPLSEFLKVYCDEGEVVWVVDVGSEEFGAMGNELCYFLG